MTQKISLLRKTQNPPQNRTQLWNSLNTAQQSFLHDQNWRWDWQITYWELSIRKTDFNTEEFTRILWLFPEAELKTLS